MQFRLIELTTALAIAQTGGVDDDTPSAMACLVNYRRGDNEYAPSTAQPEIRVYNAAVLRDGGGDPIGEPPLEVGQRGWAFFNSQSGRWELVQRDSCYAGEPTCVTVVTGVTKSAANLIFTRKQICLPPGATITDLIDVSIECCAEEGGGSG